MPTSSDLLPPSMVLDLVRGHLLRTQHLVAESTFLHPLTLNTLIGFECADCPFESGQRRTWHCEEQLVSILPEDDHIRQRLISEEARNQYLLDTYPNPPQVLSCAEEMIYTVSDHIENTGHYVRNFPWIIAREWQVGFRCKNCHQSWTVLACDIESRYSNLNSGEGRRETLKHLDTLSDFWSHALLPTRFNRILDPDDLRG